LEVLALSGVVHPWISTNQRSGRRSTMSNMPVYVVYSAVVSKQWARGATSNTL
jgi:hypothetical protein